MCALENHILENKGFIKKVDSPLHTRRDPDACNLKHFFQMWAGQRFVAYEEPSHLNVYTPRRCS